MDGFPAANEGQLAAAEALIEAWLKIQAEENPGVVGVERDRSTPESRWDGPRWMVRMAGEEKKVFAVWFHLRQRSLHVETYLAPAPLENHAEFYEYFLRRNLDLPAASYAIGVEDAVYVVATLALPWLDDAQLDRLLGTMYMATERCFRPAMRIGFGDRFTG